MFAVYGQKNVSLARRSISWAIIFNLTITPIVQNLISLSDKNSLQRSRFKIYQEKWFTQRCAGNEKFAGISIPIPGIPGKSGNGNRKFQNMHHSQNSPFPGNGNEFPLGITGIKLIVKIRFFCQKSMRSFYHRRKTVRFIS